MALLAHLQRQSVAVGAGSRVDIGTVLGAVGNSGRSPLPHLHLQVQYAPAIGAATMPFRLANYKSMSENGEEPAVWHAAAVPAENATIVAATPAPAVHAILASLAPGAAVWVVETQGRIPRTFNPTRSAENSVRVEGRFDAAGRLILRSSEGGVLTASADADAWRIIELHNARSPLLRLLALGAPSIPHAARVV